MRLPLPDSLRRIEAIQQAYEDGRLGEFFGPTWTERQPWDEPDILGRYTDETTRLPMVLYDTHIRCA